ncbi:hypothetical protein QVD17_01873 [Tagetes erecta]|uniref:glucan endo-1,3-beta-D-glucosidase n=1 Tax=Tagetes erecta TaxID=13708 RepID=A0AAD8P789_TARER|nr:hypothetical protein QVD17_01873 [Tagetes erecta]
MMATSTTHLLHFTTTVIIIFFFSGKSFASSIGINYGQIANNLPPPEKSLPLIKSIGADKIKLYDADPKLLTSFANTNIQFTVGIGNEHLPSLQDPLTAQSWIKTNLQPYLPATKITSIAVGNEVLTSNDTSLANFLLPAMQNIHNALINLNLDQQVTVTTPHSLAVLKSSYPPSSGAFKDELVSKISPVLDFLSNSCSPFLINAYPFFAYKSDSKQVSLDFALFQDNEGIVDSGNNLRYDNMLFAQIDAVYAGLSKLGHKDVMIEVSETGWPSKGDEDETGASIENAKKYNGNLLKIVKKKKRTPAMPDKEVNVFVFALFNENLKPGPTSERNYGLFKCDGTPVYGLGFSGGGNNNNKSGTFSPPYVLSPVNPSDGYMPITSSAERFVWKMNVGIRIIIILLAAVGWMV